jgi:methionyl-tRNA formyltransferase
LISKEVFDEYFCVGFHTGNLPNDRGGSPIQNKIINGEYITKVSAFRISEEIDSGEIYADKLIDLSNGTIKDILHQISQKIADMVREIAIEVPLGKQQTEGIIRFSRINEESSSLNLDNLDLRQIYDRIRMVDGYEYPKAYIEFETYYLILFDAHLYDDKLTGRCEIIPK